MYDLRTISNNRVPEIHETWLRAIVNASQRLSGELAFAEPEDVRTIATLFADSIEPAPGQIPSLVLAALILEAAVHIWEQVHKAVQNADRCACNGAIRDAVHTFTRRPSVDVKEAFRNWLSAFFLTYERHHGPTAVHRAARLIRQDPRAMWTIEKLSRAAGEPARRLARAFKLEYGVTIRMYSHMARLHTVLPLLSAEDKIDVLATEAGYVSRKDFYRVLRQILRISPGGFRRLSPPERIELENGLRQRLFETARQVVGAQRPEAVSSPADWSSPDKSGHRHSRASSDGTKQKRSPS